jgi:hypothetical protein
MLANGIRQATSTLGTGQLTLEAVAGYPTIAQALPMLGAPVAYTLIDPTTDTFIEAGIGYRSAENTFVRARVNATFVGGVYVSAAPSPANLVKPSVLIVTPHAATAASVLPTVDAVSSGVNRLLTSARRTFANSAIAVVPNRLYHIPFYLEAGAPVVSLGVNCTAAAAGANARAGIYACTENGYPGPLLAESGLIDLSTTGLKISTVSAPRALPPGWYFTSLGVGSVAATLTFYAQGAANNMGGAPFGLSGALQIEHRYESLTGGWASLPAQADASTIAVVGSSYPMVFVGI